MLHFENDYNEGVHPILLEAIVSSNEEKLPGYGMDYYCESAKQKIRLACQCLEAEVEFLSGGTQTNQIVIDSLLKPYEGVVSAETGHIAVHEAGAIEYTGHKVLTLPSYEGKVSAKDFEELMTRFYDDENHNHMVFPGMLYISQPTEYGTLYSKDELESLSRLCRHYDIPLFVDGARLGYGLAAKENTVSLPELADMVDVFYIGGTKMGALIGEAVVFTKGNRPRNFSTIVKQHGALLAKGRLIGVQFDAFFTNNLYLNIGIEALERAEELKTLLSEKGYQFYLKSPTNQQFVVMRNDDFKRLSQFVQMGFLEKYDAEHTIVRFATSWSTKPNYIEELSHIL